jgi:hypothetical protein
MSNSNEKSIGLAELIEQVKRELLSTALGQTKDAPILFVDSVELELQVTVKREGKGGIKIDVVAIGGAELRGTTGREDVHTVKVTLSPLFDKARLLEFYQTLDSDQVPKSVKQSLDALFKGDDEDPDAGII